jgi:ATP-dependent Clp protease ATP-binding subunit ClpA
MFERYTEKSRRVIFFARYEASQYGSPYLETEHILLGIMREDKAISARLLPVGAAESIRKRIESQALRRERVSTSVDLPLSNESKRVLAYAAEEAERLNHKHIGSEHLLLGLLREKKSFGAQLLRDQGVEIENARRAIAEVASEGQPLKGRVEIHGHTLDAEYVGLCAKDCRRFFWQKRTFATSDMIIHREDQRISFETPLAEDTANFEFVKGGWKEDACKICTWKLKESDDPERGIGYANGRDWLCCECYEKFVAPDAQGLDPSSIN